MPLTVKIGVEGAFFGLRVKAGARKTEIKGEYGGRVKMSVAAPPEKGKANEGVAKFLAEKLGLPKNRIKIISGLASRDKVVLVEGAGAEVAAKLEKLSHS